MMNWDEAVEVDDQKKWSEWTMKPEKKRSYKVTDYVSAFVFGTFWFYGVSLNFV